METARNLTLFLQQSGSIYHVTTEMSGRYTYANDLYRKIFFQGGPNFHDQLFQTTLFSEDVGLYKNSIEQCQTSSGQTVSVDLRRLREDGSMFWIRWEFSCFSDNDGNSTIEALGTDISERKRAENERKEVQERLARERYLLRTLIDHLPDAIYVKDTLSRHIINNKASLELIGAGSEEETIGKTAMDFFGHESAKKLIAADEKLLKSGKSIDIAEEYIVTNKGEKKWLHITKVPLKEDGQGVIGLVGISRDITERKKIEESLRRSIERFNIVSRATNDAIWDWDLIENKIIWNDSVKLLFGYSHEEIDQDNKWWENHIHPLDSKRILKKIHRHIAEGIESWQDEYRFRCKNGSYKLILDRGFILFDDQHKPYRMIGAMMDITERKKLQDELAAHNIARQRQVTEATIMAQEKERAEMGRELHDNINQILTTTKMYLDMALTEKDISEELMIKSHENISSAIEEIRILSKSLVPPSLGDIGLKEAIQEMVNNLKISQKIEIRLHTTGLGKTAIPKNMQLMVFRIVQEQMNNVLKHS
ncbi:MAG: PAS domain S-box protein, partial [Chitinophagaceae bacterium]|nr:PAS domain S-box protein [Chitinophagaceae bacterium]